MDGPVPRPVPSFGRFARPALDLDDATLPHILRTRREFCFSHMSKKNMSRFQWTSFSLVAAEAAAPLLLPTPPPG